MAYKVCIDPGHGGSDSGAPHGNHIEKTYNLDTALACRDELKKYGVTVIMTRTTDKYLSLNERCNIANKNNCDRFISIHHNSGGGDRGEVIYSKTLGNSKAMASCIAKEMKADMGQTVVNEYKKLNKAGTADYYAVIRGTDMPANIVEVCFLDNSKDVQIADTLEERKRNGREIAQGILKHLGIKVNETTVQEVEYDMEKVVVFSGDADMAAAAILADYHKCGMVKKTYYDANKIKAETVYTVGGKTGTDRFDTFKEIAGMLK